jgi:hypothetical protein
VCKQKLNRLKQIIKERENWRKQLEEIEIMRQWVVDAEHILDGKWIEQHKLTCALSPCMASEQESHAASPPMASEQIGLRFDSWRSNLARYLTSESISPKQRECLEPFLQVLSNARPHLLQCYDRKDFPRTNNETEGSIRKMKTRCRRIIGRKKWDAYLLRYGRCLAFYDWWEKVPGRWQQFEELAGGVNTERWKAARKETTAAQSEQLKRFRFRHKREKFLPTLEDRWAAAAISAAPVQTSILH